MNTPNIQPPSGQIPPSSTATDYRKRFFINRRLQLPIIFYFALCCFFCILGLLGTNLYLFQRLYQEGMAMGLPLEHTYFSFLQSQKMPFITTFLIYSLHVMVFSLILGLIISHKIAGPIHKVERHFEALLAGKNPPPLQFRKKDFWHHLAEKINKLHP